MPLVGKSARLQDEVNRALSERKKNPDEIVGTRPTALAEGDFVDVSAIGARDEPIGFSKSHADFLHRRLMRVGIRRFVDRKSWTRHRQMRAAHRPPVCRKPRPFDLMKESRTVGNDGRAALLPFKAVTFALQADQPTRG
jgi:hypothetical protein